MDVYWLYQNSFCCVSTCLCSTGCNNSYCNWNYICNYVMNSAVTGIFRCIPLGKGGRTNSSSETNKRQTKCRDEALLMSAWDLCFELTGEVTVRSNTKNLCYQQHILWDIMLGIYGHVFTNDCAKSLIELAQECHNMWGAVKHRSGSRSSHKCNDILTKSQCWHSGNMTQVYGNF